MKKLLSILIFITPLSALADFIHPMDFNGSEAQRNKVIEIIKQRVKKDYCEGAIDMCQATTLRMMEQENLKAFKEATKAESRGIMDQTINDYCNSGVDMCTYTTILMMYKQNLSASQAQLTW